MAIRVSVEEMLIKALPMISMIVITSSVMIRAIPSSPLLVIIPHASSALSTGQLVYPKGAGCATRWVHARLHHHRFLGRTSARRVKGCAVLPVWASCVVMVIEIRRMFPRLPPETVAGGAGQSDAAAPPKQMLLAS